MLKVLFGCICFIFIFSCTDNTKEKNTTTTYSIDDTMIKGNKYEMINADRNFSNLSKEKGMKTAFMEYIDSNGILLRPNERPIIGADAIDYLSQLNDSTYTIEWEPEDGTISTSGDLGFTYGYYKLTPSKKDTIIHGTYVSIWKKQSDGSWKFLLDTGNEGIGETQ